MSSNIPTGSAYEALVKKFQAEKGVKRLPTVCVSPTDGSLSDSDRKQVAAMVESRRLRHELKNAKLTPEARAKLKVKLADAEKGWTGDPIYLTAPQKVGGTINPADQARIAEREKMAVTIALEAVEKAEATLRAAGKEINNPARLVTLRQQGSKHPDGNGWSYDRLRRFLIKYRPEKTETPSRPAQAGTKGQQPAL